MNNTRKLQAIDSLLALVPPFECEPGCSACCGVAPMSRLEWKRILEDMNQRGKTEKMLKDEAKRNEDNNSYTCPMLENHKCVVYAHRPAHIGFLEATRSRLDPHHVIEVADWLAEKKNL